jgi:hypothetical protein
VRLDEALGDRQAEATTGAARPFRGPRLGAAERNFEDQPISSSGIPPHESATESRASWPSMPICTATVPSGGVCRIAFETRLPTILTSSGSLPVTTGHTSALV